MSCKTNTWPSHSTPAPIPIVGIVNSSVTFFANFAGIFSKTIEKQPASSRAFASDSN